MDDLTIEDKRDMEANQALYDHFLAHDNVIKERAGKAAQRAGEGVNTSIILNHVNAAGDAHDWNLRIPKYAITLVVARTGGGKTTWLLNLMTRMALAGENGFCITLEEPLFALRAKMMACYSRINHPNDSLNAIGVKGAIKALSKGEETDEILAFDKEVMRRCRIVDANEAIAQTDMISPTVMYDPEFIWGLIQYRNQNSNKRLDYVVIDFGQLLETHGADNSNSYQRMKSVMQCCKNLAHSLGIAVIAGAQMNRSVFNIPIWDWEPEQIRDGSDMEQAADMIIASGIDKEQPDPNYQQAARFLKNRNGPTTVSGLFNIEFDHCYIPERGIEIDGKS